MRGWSSGCKHSLKKDLWHWKQIQREIKHAEDVSDPKELISLTDEQLIAANHELELRDDTFKTLTGVVEESNRKLTSCSVQTEIELTANRTKNQHVTKKNCLQTHYLDNIFAPDSLRTDGNQQLRSEDGNS